MLNAKRNSLKHLRAKTFTITVVVILSNPKAQYLQAVATSKVLFVKLVIALLWREVLVFFMFYGRQYMLMEVIVQCLDDANSLVHVRPWREIDELDMKGVSQYSHRYKRLNRQNTSKKNSSQEKKGNI